MEYQPELKYWFENPIPLLENEDFERYFVAESLCMASKKYFVDEIAKDFRDRASFVIALNSVGERFDPFVPYLALTYFDRIFDLLKFHPDEVDIIAITCALLAMKMRDLNVTTSNFLSERPDLEGVSSEQLTAYEIKILVTLDWNLRPVTAFCFIPFIAPKLDTKFGISEQTVKEILIYAQYDIRATQFKPSTIAASAFLAVSEFLYCDQIIHLYFAISSEIHFKKSKDDVEKCMIGLIEGCYELKVTIESGSSSKDSRPVLSVRAGNQVLPRSECSPPDCKGKKIMEEILIKSKVNPAEEENEDSEEEGDKSGLNHRRRKLVLATEKVKTKKMIKKRIKNKNGIVIGSPIEEESNRVAEEEDEEEEEKEEEETERGSLDRRSNRRVRKSLRILKGCSCSVQ